MIRVCRSALLTWRTSRCARNRFCSLPALLIERYAMRCLPSSSLRAACLLPQRSCQPLPSIPLQQSLSRIVAAARAPPAPLRPFAALPPHAMPLRQLLQRYAGGERGGAMSLLCASEDYARAMARCRVARYIDERAAAMLDIVLPPPLFTVTPC